MQVAGLSANQATKDAIAVEGVGLTFPTPSGPLRALDKVSFTVKPREFVSLLGPSGCGKSTLLRLVADVLPTADGQIRIYGETPQSARQHRSFGFVFQDSTLLPWRTSLRNVMLPLEIAGARDADGSVLADRLFALMNLSEFRSSYPWQLSGGMRQRVAIARALITEPRVLLMDEPFGALDEITRERLNQELLRIWQEIETTILFVTHSTSEAIFLSDRIIVMTSRPGQVAADITIDLPRPRTLPLKETEQFTRYAADVRRALHAGSGTRE